MKVSAYPDISRRSYLRTLTHCSQLVVTPICRGNVQLNAVIYSRRVPSAKNEGVHTTALVCLFAEGDIRYGLR